MKSQAWALEICFHFYNFAFSREYVLYILDTFIIVLYKFYVFLHTKQHNKCNPGLSDIGCSVKTSIAYIPKTLVCFVSISDILRLQL